MDIINVAYRVEASAGSAMVGSLMSLAPARVPGACLGKNAPDAETFPDDQSPPSNNGLVQWNCIP